MEVILDYLGWHNIIIWSLCNGGGSWPNQLSCKKRRTERDSKCKEDPVYTVDSEDEGRKSGDNDVTCFLRLGKCTANSQKEIIFPVDELNSANY